MTNAVVRIAHFVLRLMVAVSPRERREWGKAMQAEALHVSPDNALSFALGHKLIKWVFKSAGI